MDNKTHLDIPSRKIAINYWLITHLEQLKKALLFFLIGLNALLWLYSLWGIISLTLTWRQETIALNQQLINQPSVSNLNTGPQELQFSEPVVVAAYQGKYDVVAKVTNPNVSWGVRELTYFFTSSNGQTPTTTITLGPNQANYLAALAVPSPRILTGVELIIVKRTWQKIMPEQKLNDLNLQASEIVYNPGQGSRKWVSFIAENKTLQNYWRVAWQVALYNGQVIVGYNTVDSEQFEALTSRHLEVSWFENLPGVSSVEILPYLDIYDRSASYKISGKTKEDF